MECFEAGSTPNLAMALPCPLASLRIFSKRLAAALPVMFLPVDIPAGAVQVSKQVTALLARDSPIPFCPDFFHADSCLFLFQTPDFLTCQFPAPDSLPDSFLRGPFQPVNSRQRLGWPVQLLGPQRWGD